MKKNSFRFFFAFSFIILITINNLAAEIIILSACDNKKDGFLKNEYILDLEEKVISLKTRIREMKMKIGICYLQLKREWILTYLIVLILCSSGHKLEMRL